VVGENSINNIIESLENGKVVIIDSSKLSDYEELLIGSIILENYLPNIRIIHQVY